MDAILYGNGFNPLSEKRRLSAIKSNEFYDKILKLGVTSFLTTNYDHAIYNNAVK